MTVLILRKSIKRRRVLHSVVHLFSCLFVESNCFDYWTQTFTMDEPRVEDALYFMDEVDAANGETHT